MAQITNTVSVNIGDNNGHYSKITGSFNNYKSDEDAQIMRWISPLEPNTRHQGVRNDRFEGVGDWLLETREFQEWRAGEGGADKAILFCSGNPGVGKTYLSSLVIDSLCDQAKQDDIAVACLYCDFQAQEEQTITNIMGAILKQLVGRKDIPEYVREAFQEAKKEIGGRGLRLADLTQMLRSAIALLPQIFICIDALDECLPKYLPELLGSLGDIVQESPKTRIFLTGRPHVMGAIQKYFTKAIVIPIYPKTADIRNYLKMRLDRDEEPEAMDDDLRVDIVKTIVDKMSDIFLLVSLNIDTILGGMTISERREKLEDIAKGNGLSSAYTATLRRLKAQKGNKSILGMKVLMWVLYSERPLRAEELCHALGVKIGSTDLDPKNIPALRTLITSCLGLVTVEASSSTVRLVHFTLQEHLLSDPTLFQSPPHSTIAEVCLTYLNFGSVCDLSPTLDSAPSTTPFLKYASCYWGKHAGIGITENVKMLALKLLHRFDEHISSRLLLLHYHRGGGWGSFGLLLVRPTRFTGLHAVASLGIVEIVPALLELKAWDLNAVDCTGSTALTWAAWRGYGEVLRILLERAGTNPDTPDTTYGRTPLSWAAEHGHEGLVKMLLERADVIPDRPDTTYGRTPLSWAAEHGHEGVAKMLLEQQDVNPDQPDNENETPLSLALSNGHHEVARILRDNARSHAADRGGHASPPPSLGHGKECVAETRTRSHDSNTDTTDLNTQPPLPSADPDEQEGISDLQDSVSKPADSNLSSTEPSSLPQPPSTPPLSVSPPRIETDIHPNNSPSLLSFSLNRYFLISPLICLFALLVYIFLPTPPHIFSFHK